MNKDEKDITEVMVDEIVKRIGLSFRTFGGGQSSEFNAMSIALKDKPLQFTAGVSVEEVVLCVLLEYINLLKEITQRRE